MNTVDISIIIPIYKPGFLLSLALNSIFQQDIGGASLEVIAVDDCSPDDSAKVLAAYRLTEPRLKVISQPKNLGAGPARNAGLDAATGTFVAFLDPDDTYPQGSLKGLLDAARSSGLSMVRGNILEFGDDGSGKPRYSNFDTPGIYDFATTPVLWVPWMHQQFLFKRDFLNKHGIRYPVIRRGQDTVMLARALAKCGSVQSINIIVYNYKIGVKSQNWGLAQYDCILDHFFMVRDAYLNDGHTKPWLNYLNVYWNFWRYLQNGASGNFTDPELKAFLTKSAGLFADVDEDFFHAETHLSFPLAPWRVFIYRLLRLKKYDLLQLILRSNVRLDDLMCVTQLNQMDAIKKSIVDIDRIGEILVTKLSKIEAILSIT